jgi:GntR family transcriptional repressor for pyruvate dehydrogenase complex
MSWNEPPTTEAELQENASRIVTEIVTLIRQRGYEPGDRVPSEREFSDRLGVGRAQVREAMTVLESMRYLERRRGSGVFLCKKTDSISLDALVLFAQVGLPVDPKVNDQCIEVRCMFEVQAIRLACRRRNEVDLSYLETVLSLFRDSDDFAKGASDYDYDFHFAIIKATHNEILARVVNPFYLISQGRRLAFFKDRERRSISHQQHIKMVKAIRARDEDAAEKLMFSHIGRVDSYFKAA